jgi:dTDP-4-dehydrorhamnose reductase
MAFRKNDAVFISLSEILISLMKKIIIFGANGQLGKSFRLIKDKTFVFKFLTKSQCDILDFKKVEKKINYFKPDFIINCAAFTNVDLCEVEKVEALKVNSFAILNILKILEEKNIKFIQISTDYVFNGKLFKNSSYKENDHPNPINFYGFSKLLAENFILNSKVFKKCIILRTSWLYSSFSKNFFNFVINKIKNNLNCNIIKNNFGSPSSCHALAENIINILKQDFKNGLYHITDDVNLSRFEFAKLILNVYKKYKKTNAKIFPITYKHLKNIAPRPKNSSLNIKKIKKFYKIENHSLFTNVDKIIRHSFI